MLLVPLKKDRITITGLAGEFIVSSYSALKKGGAVYIENPPDPDTPFVVMESIEAINGVLVTQKSNGLFVPKGLVKRKFSLPQIGDEIEIILSTNPQGVEDRESYEVIDLRLVDKPINPLVIVCANNAKFNLADIRGIKRKLGFEKFNEHAFKSLYLDYLPVGVKAHGDTKTKKGSSAS